MLQAESVKVTPWGGNVRFMKHSFLGISEKNSID